VLDITDLKETETARRLSEERLRLAVEATALGTWDWNLSTNELAVSDRYRAIFGVTAEAVWTYDRFLACLHPEDRPFVERAVADSLNPAVRQEYRVDYRLIWPDDTIHWVAARGRAVFEDAPGAGRAMRFLGTVMDITERKEAEAQLAASLVEKGALLKEIHHRVKNNFQIVSSLLDIESSNIEDRAARDRIAVVRQRITVLAKIHSQLYQAANLRVFRGER
jgi:PAS domain S-box-containing protein